MVIVVVYCGFVYLVMLCTGLYACKQYKVEYMQLYRRCRHPA
jgi:hypothetical protein